MNKIYQPIKFFFQKNLSSFRSQLLLSFIATSVIPVLILGFLAYNLSYSIAKKSIINAINHSSMQFNETISNRFSQMRNVAESLQYYIYPLVFHKSQSITSYLDASGNIRNYIAALKDAFNFYNITVYLKPGNLLSNEGINFLSTDQLINRRIDAKQLKSNVIEWNIFRNQKTPLVSLKGTSPVDYISCYRAMKLQNSNELEYVYFIDINEQEISEFFNTIYSDSRISNYIVDDHGYILFHPNQKMLGKRVDQELLSRIIHCGDKAISLPDRQLVVKRNAITWWYIVTEVPNSYILKNTSALIDILLVNLIVVILFTILVFFFISKNLGKKIQNFASIICQLSNIQNKHKLDQLDALTNKQPEFRDEIDQLAIVFKDMFLQLDENFDKILKISLQEEKLKYQLLQAKINPHFLYNILDSIKICLTAEKIDTANVLMSKLEKFYYLILHKDDELILIKDELEIALLYLDMENICHHKSFDWTVALDEGIEEFLVPKFTLQPLLENCIVHGLKDSGEKMHISIAIQYGVETIIITISDNGLGIKPDILSQIQQTLHEKIITVNRFYGISNVNIRISLYSPNQTNIDINSVEREGTTVKITLQQMLETESDNNL
jgi:two-component system, sensor histidine kinase YesM